MKKKLIKRCATGTQLLSPDGIYVSFPLDKIALSGGAKSTNVGGHGIAIAINEDTGETRGSSYGRGYNHSGKYGGAVKTRVPSFNAAVAGKPTDEELTTYALKLQKMHPEWGPEVYVTYVPGADENEMIEDMEKAERGEGYAKAPYNIYNHNCGIYGVNLINDAMPWYRLLSGRALNLVPAITNGVLGAVAGIGHDVEQGTPGTHTLSGIINTTGAGGRADYHGWSLPWKGTKRVTYNKDKK